MSKAMELIVAGYVKVQDRRALADLLAHRRKVLAQLQSVSVSTQRTRPKQSKKNWR